MPEGVLHEVAEDLVDLVGNTSLLDLLVNGELDGFFGIANDLAVVNRRFGPPDETVVPATVSELRGYT